MNSSSDSAGQSPNVLAGCDAVGFSENSAVHQSFQSESSRSPPTLPPSSFSNQGGQSIENYEDNFEISHSSLTPERQFSSEENGPSDMKPVIKIEPQDDICKEEKSEEADMDFHDDLIKMEDQELWDEHSVENTTDHHSISQQDLVSGWEHDVDPEIPYKKQPTRRSTRRSTNIFAVPAESLDPLMQTLEKERPTPETGKRVSRQRKKTSSSKIKLQKHMQLSNINNVHKCPFCDYNPKDKAHLILHLRTHSGVRPYECLYCDRKFSQKGNLKTHIRIHTGNRPYQCSECNFKSITLANLKVHRRIHSGEKPYQCPDCDYKSWYETNLTVHRRKHSGEKPYQCPECDYKTNCSSNLKTHQRRHSGEKPYQCPECDYKTNSSSYLKTHQRKHSGEKPYQCPECDYKAICSSNLKMHQRIHSGEKPYQCPECNFRTNTFPNLKAHRRKHSADKI